MGEGLVAQMSHPGFWLGGGGRRDECGLRSLVRRLARRWRCRAPWPGEGAAASGVSRRAHGGGVLWAKNTGRQQRRDGTCLLSRAASPSMRGSSEARARLPDATQPACRRACARRAHDGMQRPDVSALWRRGRWRAPPQSPVCVFTHSATPRCNGPGPGNKPQAPSPKPIPAART